MVLLIFDPPKFKFFMIIVRKTFSFDTFNFKFHSVISFTGGSQLSCLIFDQAFDFDRYAFNHFVVG